MQAAGGAALSGTRRAAGRAVAVLSGLTGGVVLLDQVTKQLAAVHLADAEPVRLLGGAVYLVHTTNSGAAFGIGGSYTILFAVIAFAVLGWIVWMARRLRSLPWAVALGLLAAGATGNLLDRLFREPGPFRGRVIDMVSVFASDGSVFPVFNVADSALTIGVVIALWLELTGRHRDGTRTLRSHAATSAADGR